MSERSMRKPGRAAHTVLQPAEWPKPRGYANGIKARGNFVFVGGMVGWDKDGRFAKGLAAQTKQALENIAAVLAEGGARPDHIVRMTWFICDMEDYLAVQAELGKAYRAIMGRHFPAMALVEVRRLVEREALVEIEATAVLP